MVQSVVGVFAVATSVLLVWAVLAPRGIWSALAAWSTADPRAAEPGFTSYLFRRLISLLGLLGLLGLGAAVVVTWILNPPRVAAPPTPVEQMWGIPPMVVDRVVNPLQDPPPGLTEIPVLGYQVPEDGDAPDYLRHLENFSVLGADQDELRGLLGQDPGDGYGAMDTAELILYVRGPLLCIPRAAIVKETPSQVTVAVYYGLQDPEDGSAVDNAVSCPPDNPVTAGILLPIELSEDVGDRQVMTLAGEVIEEVPLIEADD